MSVDQVVELVEDPFKPGAQRLVLKGRLGVDSARDLQKIANEALDKASDLNVCCVDVEQFHAAAVQVLLALSRNLKTRGKTCTFSGGQGNEEQLKMTGLLVC